MWQENVWGHGHPRVLQWKTEWKTEKIQSALSPTPTLSSHMEVYQPFQSNDLWFELAMRWSYPENSLWWVQQSIIHLSHMKYANHSSLTTCGWISDEMEVSRHLTLNSSAINNPSLVHSSRSVQHSKTVQFLKQFSFPSLFFPSVDHVSISKQD